MPPKEEEYDDTSEEPSVGSFSDEDVDDRVGEYDEDDEPEDRVPRQGMHWLNEPEEWSQMRTTVEMRVPPGTDYWRMTRTDECIDNAPFYFLEMEGDFEVRCKVKANYDAPDDQAGILIREDEENWVKCGIQMIGDVPHMCATVTHDYSDMSMHPLTVSREMKKFWIFDFGKANNTINCSYSSSVPFSLHRSSNNTYVTDFRICRY